MARLKVEGYTNLVRDVRSSAIVHTDKSEFQLYMQLHFLPLNKLSRLFSIFLLLLEQQ
mgnify:CR=1 FL=1